MSQVWAIVNRSTGITEETRPEGEKKATAQKRLDELADAGALHDGEPVVYELEKVERPPEPEEIEEQRKRAEKGK